MKGFLRFVPVWLGFVLVASPLVAQHQPVLKVGFMDSQKVVQAHPRYKEIQAVIEQAQKELRPLEDQLKALQPKIQAGSATAKEQQNFQTLRNAYQQASQKWAERQAKALEPITKQIDAEIARFAKAQGFGIILNRQVAASSGLVLYGDDSLDVTDGVIKAVKAIK
ncbi:MULTISPECIES: OmpH family outer membrane protein [unclassified Meiothermus]|uniref:OmpH family outer membrane protein n=1 Tax=unclassified Meiothermus TaxID=370471 RepID=UPI000D7C09D6|nr:MULTISPECIES: OmpH family outer membrane protein [unclassified Meiothermus]PZA07969.1 OmpH family outer membrane protein [Meiothermus sp. Pnk-1]RYM35346.1 OmpH family outer membrane protein [Meiothermus sp. PNK-Is4]